MASALSVERAVERVQHELCLLQVRLHADGAAVNQLLAAGVSPVTVLALYPPDYSLLTAQVRHLCTTPAEVWGFVEQMDNLLAHGKLANLYSCLKEEDYEMLPHYAGSIQQDGYFLAVCALGERVENRAGHARNLDRALQDALNSLADVQEIAAIWLAAPSKEWDHLLREVLTNLRAVLPVR